MAEPMEDSTVFRGEDLNWESGFVWVQKHAHLTIIERDKSEIKVRRHDGEYFSAPLNVLLKDYFFIDEERYLKPKYAPEKSLYANDPYQLLVDGHLYDVEVGGAVLKRDGEDLRIVPRYEYERDYAAVAFPGHLEEPNQPFPDS